MNDFKQRKAVRECKAMRRSDRCRRECMHWKRGTGMPFCKDAYSAERRK